MNVITSRKNKTVNHVRSLASDRTYRRQAGEYVCAGMKMLEDALLCGADVTSIITCNEDNESLPLSIPCYKVPDDLMRYISPLKNSSGPVFTVKIPKMYDQAEVKRAIILDTVQDPGNVGTIIRTANAFHVDKVILTGLCADLYNPKTVRASMGAIFRQDVEHLEYDEIRPFLTKHGLLLYGAALSEKAVDIRKASLHNAAVAVGSEGSGLSDKILDLCEQELIIPIDPDSESLNAAVAAAIIMWEFAR